MELFPPIEPFSTGRLRVSDIHELYYEECGNPKGNPVIFVHGGPGSGCTPMQRQLFDPAAYRIVLLDQRGAGKSTPAAETKVSELIDFIQENTTWHLVADIERLREHLGIDKWLVLGGSWGSALSLIYAESHPDRVKAIVVSGIFTGTSEEDDWVYKFGAPQVFPDHFEKFAEIIPRRERKSLFDAYYRRIMDPDPEVFVKYARAWNKWEMATGRLLIDEEGINKADKDELWSLQHAKLECHYFVNGLFLENENWILENVHKIRKIPGTIIQGRYDMTCPPFTAWKLHKSWPEADFHMVPDAGHSAKEPGIMSALVQATEKYKNI